MTPLTEKTMLLVNSLFPSESQTVRTILENECGQNLPFCENSTPQSLERLRFAALKVGNGDIEKFRQAVSLGKQDWRDLLMWADFGHDLDAHNKWADQHLPG
jgi:hypothetical protein